MDKHAAEHWWSRARDLVKSKSNRSTLADLITQTEFLGDGASVPQRLWHVINETTVVPGCKTCSAPVSWDHRYKTYKKYCGNPRCPGVDPDIIAKKLSAADSAASVKKRRATNLERYGVTNYLCAPAGRSQAATAHRARMQDPTVVAEASTRLRKRIQAKYGVENFSHLSLSSHARECLLDRSWLHEQHYVLKRTLSDIADELGIKSGPTVVGRYLRKHGLETQTLPARSTAEKHLVEWLLSLGENVLVTDRTIIRPFEMDIVLPDHKVAIEYCGVYWHSEQAGKDRQYHATKQRMCKNVGFRLITIFSDEWEQSSSIVKSKILSIIGRDDRPVIYARKCEVRGVSIDDRRTFLSQHHIQGDGSASISLGLYFNDELVAVSGWTKTSQSTWLLNRYATSCRVVGGFSKLVAMFERKFNPTTLISFADLRWSCGDVYALNGWEVDGVLPPDYSYSPDGHTRVHKFNYRRQYLPKLLQHFDPDRSEWENCKANNVLRIWDCGKLRFIKVRK